VAQLRQRAEQSQRGRLLLALADGVGLGLLGVAAMLGGQGYAAIQRWQLLSLLLGLPVLHLLCTALLDSMLRGRYAQYHRSLLRHGNLLYCVLEPELPVRYELAAQLLRTKALLPGAFEARLQAALRRWELLCRACDMQPYPPAMLLRLLPILLAALWALGLLAAQATFGLHPLTPPGIFLLTAGIYLGLQRGIARDSFALALADALDFRPE
jgi:hypothetical protein